MTASRLIFHYIRRLAIFLLAFLLSGSSLLCKGQKQPELTQPFHLKWVYEINSGVNITPATDGETIYVPLKTGNIISIRFNNGAFLWERENGGRISAVPTADTKGVYIATEIIHPQPQSSLRQMSGVLRALSQSNGVTLWTRVLPSPLRGTLASNVTTIFGCSFDGRLYAIAKETGEILWTKYNTTPFNASPILSGEHLYISDEQGNIFTLDQRTGRGARRYQTRKALLNTLVVFDRTIFAGSSDGSIYAIEEATGRFKWRVHTNAAVQSVQIAGRCLLATSLDNFVYCLSPQRGVKLWKRRLAGRIATQPLVLMESVFLSPITGEEFVVLRLRDGKVINSIFVGEDNVTEASPIFSGNLILLTTRKGLFAFSSQNIVETTQK
jgi:outer membrane protein assembly factor BamB